MRDRRQILCDGAALALGLAAARPAASEQRPAAKVTPEARKAAAAGLKYLAEKQGQDGSFGSGQFKGNVGVSSLAALALMGGGHQPDGDGAFRAQVLLTMLYVLGQDGRDPVHAGYLHNATASPHGPMYGHGFGLLFLAKLFGHVTDAEKAKKLKETLVRAIDLTVACQNREDGWRYTPGSVDADLSVTGTQMLGLRAARDAGLPVARETLARAAKYAVACQNEDGSFRYMVNGGAAGNLSRTGLGLDIIFSAGKQETPEFAKGLKYLQRHKPTGQAPQRPDMFYLYGHLHATRVLCAVGGELWAEWYAGLARELLAVQQKDGSWTDPLCPQYGTAVACILLLLPDEVLFGGR